ncbi:MAG: isoprenyl transferase [Bacteroidales bacterium]|nr:isoprenyl transferase [Bacteroidales bacterium]MCF6341339.1 isoprenyl transferase [Bacteroidales bacterium]
MSFKDKINVEKLPTHVAIIMDGNGRWARKHGYDRVFGHYQGVESVREVAEAAAELGVKYLTLYTFSTENWKRPKTEVDALMTLFVETIEKEIVTLNKNKISLNAIGDIQSMPELNSKKLMEAIERTSHNKRMVLTLALSYSSRKEILEAIRKMIDSGQFRKTEKITEKSFSSFLDTAGLPDPELLIRTSGEQRVSNFLLWQIAYAELFFTEKLWPEFGKEEFYEAIVDFQERERRFGLTSEQIKS